MRLRLALIALAVAGCASAPASGVPTRSTSTPGAMQTPSPSVRPTASAQPELVGTWVAFHDCQRIMDVMTAAGMPEQGLLNVADSGTLPGITTVGEIEHPEDPCAGAVDVEHSHFFTASGIFGSRDANKQQVDDGTWEIVDRDTVEINGTPFDFAVDGDELRMDPVDVGTCPDPNAWCKEAWKLMVAMPGMAWKRSSE